MLNFSTNFMPSCGISLELLEWKRNLFFFFLSLFFSLTYDTQNITKNESVVMMMMMMMMMMLMCVCARASVRACVRVRYGGEVGTV